MFQDLKSHINKSQRSNISSFMLFDIIFLFQKFNMTQCFRVSPSSDVYELPVNKTGMISYNSRVTSKASSMGSKCNIEMRKQVYIPYFSCYARASKEVTIIDF